MSLNNSVANNKLTEGGRVLRGLSSGLHIDSPVLEYLSKDVKGLPGVGPKTAELFLKLGVTSIDDLLQLFPRQYEDRGKIVPICELEDDTSCAICAIPTKVPIISAPHGRKGLTFCKTSFFDNTGSVSVTWFNQTYVKDYIVPGEEYVLFGRIKYRGFLPEMVNPIYEKLSDNMKRTCRIVPIYPATAGLNQNVIRKAIEKALTSLDGKLFDPIPHSIRERFKLAELNYCIRNVHFPDSDEAFMCARRRLAFQELFLFQLALFRIKQTKQTSLTKDSTSIQFSSGLGIEPFVQNLPYELTNAQKRVISEIETDMESTNVMNRLVQGDVGSGKTVVAAAAIYKAVMSGYQAALMAPTEILAEQHYASLRQFFRNEENIQICLVKGGMTAPEKRDVVDGLRSCRYMVAVGTHALIEEDVEFGQLGLVITDEQHRFGVNQRARLLTKTSNNGCKAIPDSLVMTATPIPRTLALILYGDLDISLIDELPPGRKSIVTWAIGEKKHDGALEFIHQKVLEGQQAYIVCPLIEEASDDARGDSSEKSKNLHSVEELAQQLSNSQLAGCRLAVLHGRLKPIEKKRIMDDFAAGMLDVLIATTVIEVGINVPNATVMMIENAECFGLAQLHQLRGRVGRGAEKSYCILSCRAKSKLVVERMKVMTQTTDGFEISEKDLKLRGPGDFFGTMQHGLPELRIANLYSDRDILVEVQQLAKEIKSKNTDSKSSNNEFDFLEQMADALFINQECGKTVL